MTRAKAPVTAGTLLEHYAKRYHERIGRRPSDEDLDLTVAQTFLQICGQDRAFHVMDMWFDSNDPWYASAGFELLKAFPAINRLVSTGQLKPSGTPRQQEALRRFAAALQEPWLRLVR